MLEELDKLMKANEYFHIIKSHDFDKLANDLLRIFETFPIMAERIDHINIDNDKEADEIYDMTRIMANTCNFVDCVLPIINKYNPSDEDKARFVEYIKKMEENKDE